ncbi:MAG TPA: YHYH protein [Myxococcaceae bacterium]|nr:YHYH protein [Myxococcaceae bacterium]
MPRSPAGAVPVKSLFVLALLAAVGCGPDGGTNATELTLESCTTDIASDVPAFFRTYFKCVTVTKSGDNVLIRTKSLPPHRSAYYGAGHPNYTVFDTSRGTQYRQNPNRIVQQNHLFTVPLNPTSRGLTITGAMVDRTANTNANEYRGGAVGVALDSVDIFNDQAAPGDNIDNEQYTFDNYQGHPQQTGDYHYHTATPGPLEVLRSAGLITGTTPGSQTLELYGIMCDGTLVFGCTELDGTRPSAAGLDAQNGHLLDLQDSGGTVHFTNRYHTHVCPQSFPSHKYTPEIQFYTGCVVQ